MKLFKTFFIPAYKSGDFYFRIKTDSGDYSSAYNKTSFLNTEF
ncbi:hypothetical protein TPE_0435 [Treponema pedis str. T A4]|uniref:Uncharacterized protein n=1 Tax=Treponema pedis str. T A4 TaxID=1291379 RepID=S6A2S7_9SPIR|nr:hypothetical protein TPE_0435 [Treponema pedis str. T A4]